MCEWFIHPCEVCGVEKSPPKHCLPAAVSARELAALVVQELKLKEGLRETLANDAVERILSLRYPCRP